MSNRIAVPSQIKVLDSWKENLSLDALAKRVGLPIATVNDTINQYKAGEIIPPGLFSFEGRENKRELYIQLFKMAKQYLTFGDISYCGLPAAAISWIFDNLNKEKSIGDFVAIEQSRRTYNYMRIQYTGFLEQKGICYKIQHGSVFDYQSVLKNNFFDLDLMCHLTPKTIKDISYLLRQQAVYTPTVVNVVTSYGNGLLKKTYEEILRPVLVMVLERDFKIIHHEYGNYRDRRIPMMYEHLVIQRH